MFGRFDFENGVFGCVVKFVLTKIYSTRFWYLLVHLALGVGVRFHRFFIILHFHFTKTKTKRKRLWRSEMYVSLIFFVYILNIIINIVNVVYLYICLLSAVLEFKLRSSVVVLFSFSFFLAECVLCLSVVLALFTYWLFLSHSTMTRSLLYFKFGLDYFCLFIMCLVHMPFSSIHIGDRLFNLLTPYENFNYFYYYCLRAKGKEDEKRVFIAFGMLRTLRVNQADRFQLKLFITHIQFAD